ncbi:hypothetical protein GUJ93_ZPchr0013g36650 [Zizania palustris]|uniref:Gnk2-homologous domain-containing protein n=1 Tax=Zizania palustris TaxID=103762 RepID=A0A8J5X1I5_ZIZPA|nr:hypothetical protein GUJ93_ZPchr0013g36650 [Zizania palustris]
MVYALALCRGDSDASACATCVAVAFQDAQQLCAYRKEATIFYDLCYLRFSNLDILASAANDILYFRKERNVSAPAAVFDAAVVALLNATADYAAANSSKRFATGEEAFGGWGIPSIYALVQCTPDMSPAGCRSCLADIVSMVTDPKYYSRSPNGRILGVRCNYWYELHPFFSGSPLLHLQAPKFDVAPPAPSPSQVPADMAPPANRGGRKRRAVAISVSVACSTALIISAAVFVCVIRRRRRKPPKKQSSE